MVVFQAADSIEMQARANCASLLRAKSSALDKPRAPSGSRLSEIDQFFKCKDCNRQFRSFQALGGHRASHIKLRLPNQDSAAAAAVTIAIPGEGCQQRRVRPARFRVHECKECCERFPTGQALGGHMRKHAEFTAKRKRADVEVEKVLEPDSNAAFLVLNESINKVGKRRRVVLDLDLNFPPLENDSLFKL